VPGRRTFLRGALAAGFTGAVAGAGGLLLPQSARADSVPVPTLLSLNKPSAASSVVSTAHPASAAFDGSLATYWQSQASDDQWVQVDLGQKYAVTKVVFTWGAAYASAYELLTSTDGVHWTSLSMRAQDTGGTEVPINTDPTSGFMARYVRMHGLTRGTTAGYSMEDFQVWGVPYIPLPPGSIAQGKLATASSIEGPHFPASAAFDGDLTTRWSSQFSDDQWLQVDLGQQYTVVGFKLLWEAAYAVEYGIFTSGDGTTWQEQYSTSSGYGGDVSGSSSGYPPTRYVKMEATKRGTQYGYSLWEFAVYGG
jgi:hypothetical protein